MASPLQVMIIGRGLIGGSLGLDLHAQHLAQSILYHDLNLPDSAPLSAAANVDLLIFATPVEATPGLVAACLPYLHADTILMDVGSTKSKLIASLKPILGPKIAQFIFTHPIAGKAKSGFAEAEAGLFATKPVIITPFLETNPAILQKVQQLWQSIGAEVTLMTPQEHDAFYGRYSHLSNLLAYTLKAQWQEKDAPYAHLLPPSFKAMTRLADSSPSMWRDICLSNRDEILTALHDMQKEINHLEKLIQQAEPAALLQYFHSK